MSSVVFQFKQDNSSYEEPTTCGSSYYLCSRIKCSSPMVPLSVCQVILNPPFADSGYQAAQGLLI